MAAPSLRPAPALPQAARINDNASMTAIIPGIFPFNFSIRMVTPFVCDFMLFLTTRILISGAIFIRRLVKKPYTPVVRRSNAQDRTRTMRRRMVVITEEVR
jgi:hypothetical protein